jgi:hypothetical protein
MTSIEILHNHINGLSYSGLVNVAAPLQSALSDLKREIAQDKVDAERYREIKSGYADNKVIEFRKNKYAFKVTFTNYEYEVFKTLDEAVDAAIAAKKEGV